MIENFLTCRRDGFISPEFTLRGQRSAEERHKIRESRTSSKTLSLAFLIRFTNARKLTGGKSCDNAEYVFMRLLSCEKICGAMVSGSSVCSNVMLRSTMSRPWSPRLMARLLLGMETTDSRVSSCLLEKIIKPPVHLLSHDWTQWFKFKLWFYFWMLVCFRCLFLSVLVFIIFFIY